jgi:hypothetical protein
MMATNSVSATEQHEQRMELEAVLASAEFVRAPRLAHLLSYLCEKYFAGDFNQIKEYSIGVEVFHRGAAFDQESDSIVRVEANRLRKRLAEYYAGEGAAHRLQIAIPVGQYVPKFEPNPGQAPAAVAIPSRLRVGIGWRARRVWSLAAAVLVLLAIGFAWRATRHRIQPTPLNPQAQFASPADGAQFGLPVGQEIRILAGSSRELVDHAGKLWSADAWFSGGTAVKCAVPHIWRTQEQGFYRTSRQGQFRYEIPLKKGLYELRLHFAETVFGPEGAETGGEGSRLMTVRVNGKTLLSGFDVEADAGASRTADVKIFPEIAPAADGILHLEFSGENGAPAILSAIELLPGLRGQMLPVRILPRQTPYYSNDSRWWSPDEYFEGGRQASYGTPASGTDDPDLYESDRWGNFSYAIPVAPGRYTLTLYFVARRVDADPLNPAADEGSLSSQRIFNVFCNGRGLLENFNPAKEARPQEVVVRQFKNLEPNAQGKLLLNFVPVQGYAAVSAIEVLAQ